MTPARRRTRLVDRVPTRVLDGAVCVTRESIAALAGWPPGNSVHVRARTDPAFPTPLRGARIGGRYWYPLPAVRRYLALLAKRATAKKPPAAKTGDPGDLLTPAQAAEALHVTPATIRHYVRLSRPIWDGEQAGRPMLPPPDEETEILTARGRPRMARRWYRATLTTHQAQRPGPGTGAGRPRRTPPE